MSPRISRLPILNDFFAPQKVPCHCHLLHAAVWLLEQNEGDHVVCRRSHREIPCEQSFLNVEIGYNGSNNLPPKFWAIFSRKQELTILNL